MRNPIRLKNLRLRFALLYGLGAAAVIFIRPHPLTLGLGTALVLMGAVLRSWGAGHLIKNELLTITGPYAYLRHPLYAGSLLVGSGFALISGGIASLILMAVLLPWFFMLYFPRKDRIESERLELLYGDRYASYRQAVPALVPALRAFRPEFWSDSKLAHDRSWDSQRYADNHELGTLIGLLVGDLDHS